MRVNCAAALGAPSGGRPFGGGAGLTGRGTQSIINVP
jgi:hypothetical protein